MQVEDRSLAPEDLLPFLRGVPFFESLPEEALDRVVAMTREARVEAGEYVLRAGDPGDALFVVRSGGVDLLSEHPEVQVAGVAHCGVAGFFGEAALWGPLSHTTSARATEATTLLRMDGESLGRLLAERDLALGVLASVSKALRRLGSADTASAEPGTAPSPQADSAGLSRRIQRGLLPRQAPRIHGFDIAAGTSLVDEGRGHTIWDHFTLKDGRTGLTSLSVQGEGLPPGHYLAVARSLLRELARDHDDLEGLLPRVNSGLAVSSVEGMDQYVEAGVLLPSGAGVEWAGAGRCPGAIIRRDGVFQEFTSHGPPLGMLDGFLYGTQRMELGVGDAVILLSEASPGIFRGAADLVASLQGKPVGEVVTLLQKALRRAQPDGDPEVSVVFVRRQ